MFKEQGYSKKQGPVMPESVQDKIHQFFSKYPQRVYPKGQILVFADENPQHIFYIVRGRVIKYDISYRGDEVIVNVFKPPAFFPMSWALNHNKNAFYYKAETETELHLVPADEAAKFLEDNADVALDLLKRIYKGMDGLLGRMVHLMSGTAKSRLVYELVIGCRRFGEEQGDGSYILRHNEQDIAARAGLSRETVSREMRKLKTDNLITVSDKALTIHNLPALEKMLNLAD